MYYSAINFPVQGIKLHTPVPKRPPVLYGFLPVALYPG